MNHTECLIHQKSKKLCKQKSGVSHEMNLEKIQEKQPEDSLLQQNNLQNIPLALPHQDNSWNQMSR